MADATMAEEISRRNLRERDRERIKEGWRKLSNMSMKLVSRETMDECKIRIGGSTEVERG